MPNWKRVAGLSISALAATLLVACSSDDGAASPSPSPETTSAATSSPESTSATATETAMAEPTETPVIPADGSSTTTTEVIAYQAVAPAGDVAPEQADCFSESLAAPGRTDAHRCMVGNMIYDPCFPTDATHLMCTPDPTTDNPGVFIVIAAPLATGGGASDPQPWLLQVADGTVCGAATGATAGTEGKRLNYSCTNGEWILGFPAEGEPWTAEFVVGHIGQDGLVLDERHTENIARVWR